MSGSPRGRALALVGVFSIAVAGCGSAATPTPAPTPAPTITPAPTATPVGVAEEFLARLQGARSGSLALSGQATIGDVAAALGGSIEIAGSDSATTMTLDVEGTKQTTETIRVGTQRWSRDNGGPWVLDPDPADRSKSLSGYLATLTSLEDKGVEAKGGRQLHHLVPPATAALSPEALGLDPSIKDASVTADFWARDDGTPAIWTVGATWSQGTGSTAVPAELLVDIDLAGLGVGATVAAPVDAWTGFRSTRFGYSMARDPGWTVTEAQGADQYLLDGTPYVYVVAQDAAGYTLDRFHDELVAYYAANDVVAKPDADVDYAVDGTAARSLTYHFTNDAGDALLLIDVLTVHGGKGWEIYLVKGGGGEDQARALLDTMVSTFSFEE